MIEQEKVMTALKEGATRMAEKKAKEKEKGSARQLCLCVFFRWMCAAC